MISTFLSHSCFSDPSVVYVGLQSRLGIELGALSVSPFQPGPPGGQWRGSGRLQRSLKNVWPILTPLRTEKNARLALQTGPCTCGFSGLSAHDPSASYQLAEKKQNEVQNIRTGLWGSNGGRFGEAGAMERYWRSWVWKGVGSSRTASWHWPWDSA